MATKELTKLVAVVDRGRHLMAYICDGCHAAKCYDCESLDCACYLVNHTLTAANLLRRELTATAWEKWQWGALHTYRVTEHNANARTAFSLLMPNGKSFLVTVQ